VPAVTDPDDGFGPEPGDEEFPPDDLEVPDEDDEPYSVIGAHVNYGATAGVVYGDQNIHLHRTIRRWADYLRLDQAHINDCLSGFAPPRVFRFDGEEISWDGLIKTAAEAGGAVLIGEIDTGRRTSAINLLYKAKVTLHSASVDDRQAQVPDSPPEKPEARLMELDRYQRAEEDFAQKFAVYLRELRDSQSQIVLTATRESWKNAGGSMLSSFVFRLEPPSAREVVQARAGRTPGVTEALIDSVINQTLTFSPTPRKATKLAQFLIEVAQGGSEDIARDAVKAFCNWRADLAIWFAEHQDPRERAFFIAIAFLEHMPGREILRAADELLKAVRTKSSNCLASSGIHQLIDETMAKAGPSGDVRFIRVEFASSVIDFLLDDRDAEFETGLWEWAAQLPKAPRGRMNTTIASQVAKIVLETCVRRKITRPLAVLARHWAGSTALASLLAQILTAAVLSPELGSAARRQLYYWATKWNQIPVLKTVIAVCSGEFATFYLDHAFRRLSPIAQRYPRETADAVTQAIIGLWQRPELRGRVVNYLVEWLGDPALHHIAVSASTVFAAEGSDFIRHLDPTTSHDAIAAHLTANRDTGFTIVLRTWLDQAAADEALAAHLIELLSSAARHSKAPASTVTLICRTAYQWQPVDADHDLERHALLRERLVERLHQNDIILNTDSNSR
jgi:hypothetical protein